MDDLHDTEIERNLIGCLLVDISKMDAVEAALTIDAGDFIDENLGQLWGVLRQCRDQGKPADAALLLRSCKRLKVADPPNWAQLITAALNGVPNSSHAAYYGSLVKQASQRRQLAIVAAEIEANTKSDDTPEQIYADATERLDSVMDDAESTAETIQDACLTWSVDFELRGTESAVVFATGYEDLDRCLAGGLRPGELCVVAGRPGTGKSAFALGIIDQVSKRDPVFIASLEMNDIEVVDRWLSRCARVELYHMRSGTCTVSDRQRLIEQSANLANRNVQLTEECHLDRITAQVRQWRRRNGCPGLVVIDYLQLIEAAEKRNQNRQEVVSMMTRRLKRLASDTGCPVVLLSQLNRMADGVQPRLAHLRESGAIEQDANQVVMLWEGRETDGELPIKVCLEKNRSGRTSSDIKIVFVKRYVSMENVPMDRVTAFDDWNNGASSDSEEF